jgi:hypothetical protein
MIDVHINPDPVRQIHRVGIGVGVHSQLHGLLGVVPSSLYPYKKPARVAGLNLSALVIGAGLPKWDGARLSGPEPVYLALGDLDDLAALETDIEQLPIGELFKLVERGKAGEPLAKTAEGATDEISPLDFVGMAEGDFSEVGHDRNLSVILEAECVTER